MQTIDHIQNSLFTYAFVQIITASITRSIKKVTK